MKVIFPNIQSFAKQYFNVYVDILGIHQPLQDQIHTTKENLALQILIKCGTEKWNQEYI